MEGSLRYDARVGGFRPKGLKVVMAVLVTRPIRLEVMISCACGGESGHGSA